MRATRLLKSRLKARTAPVAKVVTEPEDPMKGFQTAGGGSALLERAGKRYYESERGPFYNPVVTGFVPNEVNR